MEKFFLYKVTGRKAVKEISLLFDALSIDFETIKNESSTEFFVDETDYKKAELELELFFKEKELHVEKESVKLLKINKFALYIPFLLLIAFHLFLVLSGKYSSVVYNWKSSASRITDGEWWVALTALSLHSGFKHVFSNVVSGIIFVGGVGRLIGLKITWVLVILAGFMGNIFNAYYYGSAHNSIGFSTAVFAASGILAALQFFDKYRMKKVKRWIPFAAALALLAMLGSSVKTDYMAHFFGFGAGVLLGIIKGFADSKLADRR